MSPPDVREEIAMNKRKAILFTCLVSRGIHIELVEELSTSSFINALRRFVSIRGPVRQFRSDRGTNFIGAVNELQMVHQFVEKPLVQKFLHEGESTWLFNPPHASHFGGVWESMIGITRRILDGILLRTGMKSLTHETLSTFMAEVCAIVNSRPLTPLSENPSEYALTPAMILTHKTGPLPNSIPTIDPKELYKSQWRFVQNLASEFWRKWKDEYLSTLQIGRKWTSEEPSLKEGDIADIHPGTIGPLRASLHTDRSFFLRRIALDFDFEDVKGPDGEGPGSVRVLFASSAEEEEIVTALIADRDTLAEGALDRGRKEILYKKAGPPAQFIDLRLFTHNRPEDIQEVRKVYVKNICL
uniref:Uncharacterized protein LOC111109110 n=1 Tax=Crassostrea virginica TaxID=6565 RepID=A0A8B8BBV1_CRAVI|nr:uncharacterized protein LOC111109110 [Crassostrea virginica]